MQAIDSSDKKQKNDKSRDWLYNHSASYQSELGKMPVLERNGFVVAWLYEVGFYKHGGMGILPIEHTDIMSWRLNTRTEVEPEDVNLLIMLSKIYVNQYRKSDNRDEPPPTVQVVQDRAKLDNQLKGAFRRLANPSK